MENAIEKLSKLQLAGKAAISLAKPGDEYFLHMDAQPCSNTNARLAVTSSSGTIRLYSRNDLTYIGTVQGDGSVLTGVKFAHEDPGLIFASTKAGTVKCWDMRADLMNPALTFKGFEETHNVFTAFDLSCNDRVICAGTEARINKKEEESECYLIFWDHRKTEQLGVYSESHQDDITQVKFHPSEPDSLITGSTDGLVCLFDISETCEDDAIQTTLNSQSSVNTVGWCGHDAQEIYCLTHIETLHVWGATEYEDITEIADVRTKFKGKQKVDYLVDCFNTEGVNSTLLLTGNHSGQLQVFNIDKNQLKHICSFEGGHSATVRCSTWDEQTRTMVTGGEDAMLCLWKVDETGTPTPSKHKLKSTSHWKAKVKKQASKGSKPF